MPAPRLSSQTPMTRGFPYDPLSGAMLHLFSRDHDPSKTRRMPILAAEPTTDCYRGVCQAPGATYIVTVHKTTSQVTVHLFGMDGSTKKIENFSVVYPGKRKKKVFGTY